MMYWNHLLGAVACSNSGELVKECDCAECVDFRRLRRAQRTDWCGACDRHQDACECAPVVTELSA